MVGSTFRLAAAPLNPLHAVQEKAVSNNVNTDAVAAIFRTKILHQSSDACTPTSLKYSGGGPLRATNATLKVRQANGFAKHRRGYTQRRPNRRAYPSDGPNDEHELMRGRSLIVDLASVTSHRVV